MAGAPSVLCVNSGSSIKYFTLQKAKEMGLKTILVKDRMEWEKPYVDFFIPQTRLQLFPDDSWFRPLSLKAHNN